MKQIKNDKICKYCLGCNKLLDENFEGVRNCKRFMQGQDMNEYYTSLREAKDDIQI